MTILASATVDDGYNGHICRVTLNYRDGYVIELHEGGSHRGPLPQCASINEALWMLANHPTAKRRYSRVTWHKAIAGWSTPYLRDVKHPSKPLPAPLVRDEMAEHDPWEL